MSTKKKKNSNYKPNAPKSPEQKKSTGHKGLKTALIITGIVLLIAAISIFFYLRGCYKPDGDALEQLRSDEYITVDQQKGQTVFAPKEATTGFIFYPGANVEHTAYAPMAAWMAREGVFCVLVDSPLNHAFLDTDAADDIIAANPQITKWYVGGHSLGGAMAASYADKNADKLEGLILLASYSTKDLTDTDLKVLSIYGDRDKILNLKKYEKNLSNLPASYKEIVIPTANHAYFGSYGDQKNDGVAGISSYVQSKIAAEHILEFIK